MPVDHILRGVLAIALLAAVLMSGPVGRRVVPHRGWPLRVLLVGMFILLIYLLVGQVKAFNLHIRFDWVSAIGLIGALTVDTGLAWFLRQQRRHERG